MQRSYGDWSHLKSFAREMRQSPTPAEERLWHMLRGRRFKYAKFRRQHAIGPFIVDFYCSAFRLVIEVDGEVHDAQKDYDQLRDGLLSSLGLKIVRFRNEEVLDDVERVLKQITSHLTS